MDLCFEDCIDDERVFAYILREDLRFLIIIGEKCCSLFTSEQIDFDLFS